jgi:hypothetical protein
VTSASFPARIPSMAWGYTPAGGADGSRSLAYPSSRRMFAMTSA